MRRRSFRWPLVAVAVLALGLGACSAANATAAASAGSPVAPTAPAATPNATATVTARSVACAGLATVNQKLASLATGKSDMTVGEVKAAQQKVATTLNTIESKIPAADGNLMNQIKSANAKLADKIAGYPDTTPIGQTSVKVQNIQSTAASAQAKTQLLAIAIKCPPLSTPTPAR